MAKKQKDVRPYVDVQHEYADSLQRLKDSAIMLLNASRSILDMVDKGHVTDAKKVAEHMREYVDNLQKAMYGDQ